MLEVQNLSIVFGGLKAVSDFNLTINEKEIVGLLDLMALVRLLYLTC